MTAMALASGGIKRERFFDAPFSDGRSKLELFWRRSIRQAKS
jgi:hypothetical protein